jgi:DNA-binding response OmpR family regulator
MESRILIVDDEEAVASMLKVVFETDGYTVVSASSAAEAEELLASNSFDAVITDMKMETDTAGYDVVRAARAHPQRPAIMILSAFPLLVQDWRSAGADAVASKPTNMTQLLNTLAELVSKRRQRSARIS